MHKDLKYHCLTNMTYVDIKNNGYSDKENKRFLKQYIFVYDDIIKLLPYI